jgi:hypothetical protein
MSLHTSFPYLTLVVLGVIVIVGGGLTLGVHLFLVFTFVNSHDKFILRTHFEMYREPGSSASIVSGYGLDNRSIEFRSQAVAKGFCL